MKFRINYSDSGRTKILKLMDLIPFIILMYIPYVIYLGVKEFGNPFSQLKDSLK